MNRRTFLQGLAAIIAVPALPKITENLDLLKVEEKQTFAVTEKTIQEETLQSLKQDNSIINVGTHHKALWPGVNEWFKNHYDNV